MVAAAASAPAVQLSAAPTLRSRRHRHLVVAAAAPEPAAGEASSAPLPVPRGPQETVAQAVAACTRAWEAGVKRQRVELLLPLIGATDLDDWPGGIRQQFKASRGGEHGGSEEGAGFYQC